MKKKILMLMFLGASMSAIGQEGSVGIGTSKPDNSAILDLSSSKKGLLMPRMSAKDREAINNPAQGLLVFQTDKDPGFYYFENKQWRPLSENEAFSVTDANNWGLTGNAGTNSTTNFIGTTDNVPLVIKTNNQMSGLVDPNGLTTFGYLAGSNTSPAASRNFAFGAYALRLNTTGNFNSAIGFQALNSNQTGNKNLAIGDLALYSNTIGDWNVSLGSQSLYTNTSGSWNTAVGPNVLVVGNGNSNVGIGYEALRYVTGSNNIGIGAGAGIGVSSNPFSSATNNVFIGHQAGNIVSSGSGNLFIGYQAGMQEPSTSSSKLILSNSNTLTPLVYGDFTAKYLAIGEVGTTERAAATSGGYRLLVKGGMITEKIKVAVAGTSDWADYVFEPSYNLLSLEKVESFVKENKHLPNVPSAEEMTKIGLDVTKTSAKLLEKIEELTLYMIEMNKEIKALKAENIKLKK